MGVTLGSLIIQIAGDNSGLKRSLEASTKLTAQFKQQMNTARGEFASSAIRLREDLFSGALSPAAFNKQGIQAAKEYNKSVLSTISDLRSNGQLTTRLHASLVQELQDIGLDSGKSFLAGFGQAMQGIGTTLKGVGTKLTLGATLPIAAEGVAAFKAASDANEEANAFQVTFGPLAEGVQRQLDQMHRTIPVTTTDLQHLAGGFGALLLPMGFTGAKASEMSTRLVKLAGDIQSLRNIPFNEVVQRLTSGLVGETEAVRRLGANIGEVALKTEAMRLGFGSNTTALTSMQKATAVYNILLRDTALATGDAQNTMNSAANTVRFAKRNFDELQITIGQRLIPILTPLAQKLSDMLERMKGTSSETVLFYVKLAGIVAVAGPVITAIGGIASALGGLARAVTFVRGVIAGEQAVGLVGGIKALMLAISGPAGWVIGIGLAITALITWADRMHDAKHAMEELRESAKGMTREQLAAEISRRASAIGELQKQQLTAPLIASDATATNRRTGDVIAATGGGPTITKSQLATQIAAQQQALKAYTDQWHALTDDETLANNTAAKQLALWQQLQKQFQDAATTAAKATPASKIASTLEALLGQIEQTQKALGGRANTAALKDVWTRATDALLAYNAELVRTGKLSDQTSLKLEEVAARAAAAMFAGAKIPAIAGPLANIPGTIGGMSASMFSPNQRALGLAPAGTTVISGFEPQFGRPGAAPITVPTPQAATLPAPEISANVARFKLALDTAESAVKTFGGTLGGMIKSGAIQAISSIAGQLNPFAQVIAAIGEAAKPLAPVMAKIANMVAQTLGPVFEALAPVIDALIPVMRAVLQVLAPILKALAPLLMAFVPILNALFPIFKLLGIAATYIGQAFAEGGSIFLRVVGNVVIGFGTIIKALAIAIDKLPFVSAKGAINAAQGIIDFGKGLLSASDEFKQTAKDMADAREQIKGVTIDNATDSLNGLATAADSAAAAMLNVPSVFRYNLRVAEQWTPEQWSPGGGPGAPGSLLHPPGNMPVGQPGGPTSTPGTPTFHVAGDVIIQTSGDGEETYNNFRDEAERRALATSGQSSRWQEAL